MGRFGWLLLVSSLMLGSLSQVYSIEVPDETWAEIKSEVSAIVKLNEELQIQLQGSKDQLTEVQVELGKSKKDLIEVQSLSQNQISISNEYKDLWDKSKKESNIYRILNIVQLVVLSSFAMFVVIN